MKIAINKGDTILLELGDGLFREVSHEVLKDQFGRVNKYNQTKTGSVKRAISLYDTAKRKGKFSNGTEATPERLVKMKAKIEARILDLFPHEREQVKCLI